MGACDDIPATAPQWGRSAPPSPSGALLPILRLVVLATRRVSGATGSSPQHLVIALVVKICMEFGMIRTARRRPAQSSQPRAAMGSQSCRLLLQQEAIWRGAHSPKPARH